MQQAKLATFLQSATRASLQVNNHCVNYCIEHYMCGAVPEGTAWEYRTR